MRNQEFDRILERQLDHTRSVLASKAEEYADGGDEDRDEDRLHNFRVAAALMGCNNRQALAGMLSKHIVSIFDLIREEDCADQAVWDEKIGDAINYLVLLQAVVADEQRGKLDKPYSDWEDNSYIVKAEPPPQFIRRFIPDLQIINNLPDPHNEKGN